VRLYEQQFRQYLAGRGLTLTQDRKAILDRIYAHHEHFEAKALLLSLRASGHHISKATLYRTLALLVESGLLAQVSFGERHGHYEHILGHRHHDHLLCTRCGKVIEFTSLAIERLQGKVCREHRFIATGHRMRIFGYCYDCARARRKKR
jgi:Fur family ferric uptake transcriptional regulator